MMRINVTKAVLLTIAGAALVLLPRRSSKKDTTHSLTQKPNNTNADNNLDKNNTDNLPNDKL